MTALTDAELVRLVARAGARVPGGDHERLVTRAVAELRLLRGEAERMRAVVEAAERYEASPRYDGTEALELKMAAAAYRAAKETGR